MRFYTTSPMAFVSETVKRREFRWKSVLQGEAQLFSEMLLARMTPF